MYDDWGMWEEASRDYETEGFERKVAAARVAAAGTFKFLANAKDEAEYIWREEYAADTLAKAASHDPAVLTRLLDELREDFRVLAIVTRLAEEEKGKFIIVDEESGYKVGGPFSSRSDAEQAVNSDKFKDKEVKVEQVGEEEEKKEDEHPGGKGNHDEAGGTKPLDKDSDDEEGGED
jgi:hypothetical protein